MKDDVVYKIKDSVDLFLSNGKYIVAYFVNSRQRKMFRVNTEMIKLLENIDGEKDLGNLKIVMEKKYDISQKHTENVIKIMLDSRIITPVIRKQNILPDSDVHRYSRQINYFSEFLQSELDGIKAQKNIMDSHIILFGCGAVGGNIALELAMAGVRNISLYDYDTVQKSDVARHMYYKEEYLGMHKTDALKKELKKINSKINTTTYNEKMLPHMNIEFLIKKADFVINTLDEPYIGYTASKISRVCMKYNIPHFIAGGFDAHLSSTGELIIPYVTPCVECYAKHFKIALKGWKPENHPVLDRHMDIGGLASSSLFSSSYACIEILKYLAGLVDMKKNYKIRGEFLFYDMSLNYLNVTRNPNCVVCGETAKNEP